MPVPQNAGLIIAVLFATCIIAIVPAAAVDGTAGTDGQSNVVIFGNSQGAYHQPSGTDYSTLGGSSAIRRDGSIDTFYDPYVWKLTGYMTDGAPTKWAMVTTGAAVSQDGCLYSGFNSVIPHPGEKAPLLNESCLPKDKIRWVAVSQPMNYSSYTGWPVIYQDENGDTHLAMKKPFSRPSSENLPGGTGWVMISSSSDHALALRSDGTVAGWGNNEYHQLDLPAGIKYIDIAASARHSIGLSADGRIYLAGPADSLVNNKPEDAGILSVVMDNETAACLTHDGHIVVFGEEKPGIKAPEDGGYTDIALGPDYLIAIKEPAPELHLTGPLSPGKPVSCLESNQYSDEELMIPYGSTIEHTMNDVTRIIRPDGTEVGWANDAEAAEILTTQGLSKSSFVHELPATFTIVPDEQTGEVIIENPSNGQMIMRSIIHHSITIQSSSIPTGICYSNTDCGITDSIGNETYMSQPFSISADNVPRFAVTVSGDAVVGTFCEADKAGNCIDKQATVTHKKIKLGPDNPLRVGLTQYSSHFTTPGNFLPFVASCYPVVSANGRKIDGTTYCVGGVEPAILWSSSGGIAKYIDDTHQIIKKVFDTKECVNSNECTLSGSWTADATDTYFHYSNTVVTLPAGSTTPQWILPAISGNIVVS